MKPWQDCALLDNTLFPQHYRIVEMLRESAANRIFLCFDEQRGDNVIIKCFKQSSSGTYLREIGAIYGLQHPNLVCCLTTFYNNMGEACLVYEYFPHGHLAAFLESVGRLDTGQVFRCLDHLLSALIYLHALNRIHCDIKPENIFLRGGTDGVPEFVLGDLGAACFLREAQEGQYVTGTPAYIAPERIRNEFFFNSDLYSLGVVGFELVTGYRPFLGTVEEITQANLSYIPTLEAICYPPLRDLIDHLLAKSPQKRLPSAYLANVYLKKLQAQHQQAANIPIANRPSLLVSQTPLTVGDNLLAIQCLHTPERLFVCLTYAAHTDIIDPSCPNTIIVTLLHTAPLQVTGPGSVAYATPTRIQQLDINTLMTTTLLGQINNPKKFYANNGILLFTDDYHVYCHNLANNSHFTFRSPSYLFDPKISVFENGSFYISGGMANEKLVKRNVQGDILSEWQLDGPLVAMTHCIDDNILGASLSIQDNNQYAIWHLHDNGTNHKWLLTDKIRQISCTKHAIFWLTETAELYCCGPNLQHKILGCYAPNTSKFAVSFDSQYITLLEDIGQNQAMMSIIKIQET